ncbi:MULTISPECIES: hypothetical protein [unclassified Mesorhizobium]|uniref:hypothetical protein n=1 Tax=unclassified Mesorhizobium TaxID=325217 RepID=UPI0003CEE1F0|nr:MULTISPECIES: hypothetical protein [unclassified Mesorhizobium]ESY20231.1 hypothetical protein X751_12150 [Mesorhizobium sp. LNJC395A00]WJI77231.1 hypothetical protein NLY37_11240 [Mesorhizobium sp. C395A]
MAQEMVLVVKMVHAVRDHAIVADRIERDHPAAARVADMVDQLRVKRLILRITVGADQPIKDMADRERPVFPVFGENHVDRIEQRQRLGLRLVVGDVALRSASFTARRNFAHVARARRRFASLIASIASAAVRPNACFRWGIIGRLMRSRLPDRSQAAASSIAALCS